MDEGDTGTLHEPPEGPQELVLLSGIFKDVFEPLARAEEVRAKEATEQVRLAFMHEEAKDKRRLGLIVFVLFIAILGWSTGEVSIVQILTHCGALVAGYAVGKNVQE